MDSLKKQVRDFWDNNPLFAGEASVAPGEAAYFQQHEDVYRRDVFQGTVPDHFYPFAGGAKVLEVGCGPGFWTRELARRGYDVTAVDLAPSAVELARKGLAVYGLNADVRIADAEQLPFPDGAFQGVVSHGVIHHTPDTQACLNEFRRVLGPDGTVVVSVYYRNVILRSQTLTMLASKVLAPFVGLKGRGRERMLESGDADEIVRLYDGAANPVGKSYTRPAFLEMLRKARLKPCRVWRFYVPLRSLGPLGAPLRPFQKLISGAFGLMLAVEARVAK